jgi:oligo-1,6-glucosidase
MRHEDPVVSLGDFRMIAQEHPTLFAFERRLDAAALLVVANFDEQPLELGGLIDVDVRARKLVLGNYSPAAPDARLRPWEVRVLSG